ncbi:MAG: sugar phosphate isomerase/epimerase [Lentisphaerae bacterium]|jgi:sugar phosphate isomerase/epimerase|nr:sugar phosphate isomerase/epimerase [Lentisphaerota bacterium]MBT4815595.1 sugar phosphate isomerase/epimerase [Lentisphaerota bacterium]MBT5605543.1 sugar phosphate isomerase/epimerase [Lentisphaerota bacterium]MBT7056820.1 sugar phosphate isomerase/epimerase [Lentisphaerota bacterium]MBT7845394.1 sugar phosphate isomerase/epimerase [Lentisphaerota bacterium]
MKYAVMTFMYRGHIDRGDITHEGLVQLLADAGAQGIEAFDRDFLSDPSLIRRYQTAMRDAEISMPVIDVMVNLVYTSASERQDRVDGLRRGLDLCGEMGAEIAHVAGSRLDGSVAPADGRKMMAELLGEHADYAAGRGLVLGIEDFDPSPDLVCKAADCVEIMQASGNAVKLVFDTGNFQAVGERADEVLDSVYDRICHCHFKDFVADASPKGYSGTVYGTGMIPNQAVAEDLLRRGYDGWVALESYPQNGAGPRETVSGELATLKAMFGE